MIASIDAIYKLTILYMMDSVTMSLSNAIISDFLLKENLTDYFNIQIALNELETDGLITSSSTYSTTYYSITGDGKETLDCFHNELTPTLKNHVRTYIKEHSSEIVEMLSVKTDYEISGNGYLARCDIYERGTLLTSISLQVDTEEQAQHICNNYRLSSSEIYAFLIRTLMK